MLLWDISKNMLLIFCYNVVQIIFLKAKKDIVKKEVTFISGKTDIQEQAAANWKMSGS